MRLLAAMLLCVIGLSASTPQTRATAETLPHDAYVWQRIWTPQLIAAAHRSSDIVRAWRVLLAEADRSGRWTTIAIPWNDILATQRPIIAVVRIDGRLDEARMPAMLDQLVSRIEDAVARPAVVLAGVEVDYDCPTSKLPTYARFLAEFRTRLARPIALSITALPTWMNSAELERLAKDVDEVMLQVHAVEEPRRGLFNPAQAALWVEEFGRRIRRPFRVALPAYDVRVSWQADGRLASVEGEVPLLSGARDSELLGAAPEAVLQFLQSLQRTAPQGLIGIAWFRLPTDADARSWSPQTWRAVVTGTLPPSRLNAGLVPTERSDLWTVTLANDGPVDAALPRQVRLDPACAMADGANGFRLMAGGTQPDRPLVLEAAMGGRLRAHHQRVIGWARCTEPGRALHVAQ
ncbi:MAG TPA: DUF3142 domain-containing protein [Reyranella sp.]|jgi:hypothetical protein|nr:DUF3142 domain-containing protein [Reyranella sp.]